MKKILFFAIALVASVLTFTSCNGNNPNDPLVGTWQHIEDYGDARSEQKVTFDGRDNFTYSDFKYMGDQVHYGQIIKGSYKIDGDIVTISYAECVQCSLAGSCCRCWPIRRRRSSGPNHWPKPSRSTCRSRC